MKLDRAIEAFKDNEIVFRISESPAYRTLCEILADNGFSVAPSAPSSDLSMYEYSLNTKRRGYPYLRNLGNRSDMVVAGTTATDRGILIAEDLDEIVNGNEAVISAALEIMAGGATND